METPSKYKEGTAELGRRNKNTPARPSSNVTDTRAFVGVNISQRPKKYFFGTLFFLSAIALIYIFPVFFKTVIRIDNIFFSETIREIYAEAIANERWADTQKIPAGMNYDWLSGSTTYLKIGHALGSSGGALANELASLSEARAKGFKFLEVDLWLSSDNTIRCFHGPGTPGALTKNTCTFDRLISATSASGEFLILDIKTDFYSTLKRIDESLKGTPRERRRVILQLYQPRDIRYFAILPSAKDYPGPILTAYSARASLNAIYNGAKKANIRALTIPFHRRFALKRDEESNIAIFVHPIHSCETAREAKMWGADGIYTLSSLRC
jgi:hypothetical protein